ncbi:10757_t:CDS:2 [Diversispora eburnea]|uniref:10757_t:CDS:1 n=1 Tax=Diversispora eburnea TaxID=1213867 RepID=A0A9N9GAM2_9GLOM|nr:10757_t:CDS:2 [Diversispora eburnea]
MAIASFESQEEKDQVINFEWIAGEYRQDIKEIKEQVKDIDERLELVETHCAYEILNNEEVKEMDISDNENEEMNEKEKSKAQTTNDKKEGKEMEKTINYIYETVKALLEENKTTLARLNGVEKHIEKNNEQDQIWVSDYLADQLFYADIIPSDLKSHSDHIFAIAEIEDNILKYTKSITDSDKILNKIEFKFKGTSEKK